jgi:hypothetical protein
MDLMKLCALRSALAGGSAGAAACQHICACGEYVDSAAGGEARAAGVGPVGRGGGVQHPILASCKVSARAEPSARRRMMSDWSVELVNDNVNEFYVEFKGPPDSACPAPPAAPRPVLVLRWLRQGQCPGKQRLAQRRARAQARTRAASGRCTWSCQTITRTSRHPSALSTGYTTQTWMKCVLALLPCLRLWQARGARAGRAERVPRARRAGSVCLDVINQTWSPMFGAGSGPIATRCLPGRNSTSLRRAPDWPPLVASCSMSWRACVWPVSRPWRGPWQGALHVQLAGGHD